MIGLDAPSGAWMIWKAQPARTPPLTEWPKDSIQKASTPTLASLPCKWGRAGTIPLMGMLSKSFPKAQSVMEPGSTAHGPIEFLHVPLAKGLTACAPQVLADQAVHGLV